MIMTRTCYSKNISYKILQIMLFVVIFIYAGKVLPQTGIIKGTVNDSKNNEPLPAVNISLLGTVLGTTTDKNGNFYLPNIPFGEYNVRFTMMGYKKVDKQININRTDSQQFDIRLQPTILETPELVITANKRRQSIQDSPTSIGVMTSLDFREKNEIYLDNLLEHASGVNFVGSQINIRGSSGFSYGAGSRVLLLIDGVPVMPGDSGDIKWDIIPASQIERIEIIKGAGSALYGTSAFGGAVNVITKSAEGPPKTNVRYSVGMYAKPGYKEWQWTDRTLHFENLDVDHTRQLGKSGLFMSFGRRQSTGYSQSGHYLRFNGSMKWKYQINGQQNFTISSNYEGGYRGSALLWRSQRNALEVDPVALGDYVDSNKLNVNAFHNLIASKSFRLKTRVSYFRNYWKNFFHDNITASTAQRYGLEVQADVQISQNHSLTMGTEETLDHVASGLVGDHDQHVLAFFLQNEQQLFKNMTTTIGLRYDYHNVDTGFKDSQWNPKFGLVYHLNQGVTFRASTGRGFRAASMSERFADSIYSGLRLVPNENLKSETAWSHEAGFSIVPSPLFYLDAAVFRNDYWDLIEPEPDETQTVQFINITRARITGVETILKIVPFYSNVTVDIGYTYMDPQDLDKNITLAYRPNHIFNISGLYHIGFMQIGCNYRYISKIENVKVYPADDRVPQKVVNASVQLTRGNYSLGFNVNNIFNDYYTQMERTLEPIRHYYVTLTASY